MECPFLSGGYALLRHQLSEINIPASAFFDWCQGWTLKDNMSLEPAAKSCLLSTLMILFVGWILGLS